MVSSLSKAVSQAGDVLNTTAVDVRKIAAMRFLLAVSGLVIILIDPLEPDRLVGITYAVLALYTLYSVGIYLLSLRHQSLPQVSGNWAHWADIAWYVLLISLSNGTSSIFFFGFFFAILTASFRWGFFEGLRATLTSTIAFGVVGLLTSRIDPQFQLDRFLLRPVYLGVLGYMLAYWGGQEMELKRRLALLREVSSQSNPRFGVDRMLSLLVEGLCNFFPGSSCLLVMEDTAPDRYLLFQAKGSDGCTSSNTVLPAQVAQALTSLADGHNVVYNSHPSVLRRSNELCSAYDVETWKQVPADKEVCGQIAEFLDARAFVSVPVRDPRVVGRLYVASQLRAFDLEDAQFLLQVGDQAPPFISNIKLVDRLASDAAEIERQKIARDIHDSVIQPYIAIHMALSAVRAKLQADGNSAAADITRVMNLTSGGIIDLRAFIQELTGQADRGPSLIPAIERFVAKFSGATGIKVNIAAQGNISINDRLAAEVFQIVEEGLSNVRRHTNAKEVTVDVATSDNKLVVKIENDDGGLEEWQPFVPRSITGRSTALGGRALVEKSSADTTRVTVEIPL